jgi:3'-phosphoadenosine 5'-phosphosulfate (PAPS) 3'-phosphatase
MLEDDDGGRCKDVQTALLAVFAGCRAAHMVQPRGRDGIVPSPSSDPPSSNDDYDDPIGIMTKDDTSPVTIGDYAAQAAVLHILNTTTFGTTTSNDDDAYIAEEGSDALLGIIRQQRRQQHHSSSSSSSSSSSTFSSTHSRKENSVIENILHVTNRATAGLLIEEGPTTTTTTTTTYKKSIPTVESLLDVIDHRGRGDDGDVDGSRKRRRVWCLNPIDGTKGFLRGRISGGQYCVALALMEDGIPIIGILGCPNMPTTNTYTSSSTSTSTSSIPQYGHWSEDEIILFDKAEEENRKNEMHVDDDDDDRSFALFSSMPKRGCVFLAVRGYGCYEVSLHELEKHYLGNERKRNIPSDGNPSDKKWRSHNYCGQDCKLPHQRPKIMTLMHDQIMLFPMANSV